MLEKITVSDEFRSPLLSQACGFEVTITVIGSLRVLSFPNRPVGPAGPEHRQHHSRRHRGRQTDNVQER